MQNNDIHIRIVEVLLSCGPWAGHDDMDCNPYGVFRPERGTVCTESYIVCTVCTV